MYVCYYREDGSGVTFNPEKVDIVLESEEGSLAIVKDGIATDYSEEKLS